MEEKEVRQTRQTEGNRGADGRGEQLEAAGEQFEGSTSDRGSSV